MKNWLPKGIEKPSWAGLFGAAPVLYIFWDPYQNGASWVEWSWTAIAFISFLILTVLSSIYWANKRVMQIVCICMAVLAFCFSIYRPSGIIFYIFVAAFAPLAVSGSIAGSSLIVFGAVLLIIGQWTLLRLFAWMPYIVAAEAVLVGAAITVVIRQQTALRRTLKTAERERIARDLHDILGHTLSVIILKSELASRLLEQDARLAKVQIEDVERISRRALEEIREAIVGYRVGDLAAELARAKSTLETAGIEVRQEYDVVEMPVAQERVLALVLREAITNVVRHAHATSCSIRLTRTQGACLLEIQDDGLGGTLNEGMGMLGIRERVAAIGGRVIWSSTAGTRISVEAPLEATVHGELA
jgi:two-component system, NarL family, sensor histidine kinase DesK